MDEEKKRVLIVEDEEKLARFVELELVHEGYCADKAPDGVTGLEMAQSGGYDLILLDVMLPGLSGLEVLRRIRRSSDVPIVLLTARDAVVDKVSGLDGGANDYITKPFSIEELLARIRAALRSRVLASEGRRASGGQAYLTAGDVLLDREGRTLKCGGQPVELTRREFDLLEALMENKNIVLTRDGLLDRVWGYDYVGETNVVDVYIRYLRVKIDDAFGIKLIHTVRGVGYVINDE